MSLETSVDRIQSTPFLHITRKHSLDVPTAGMLVSSEVAIDSMAPRGFFIELRPHIGISYDTGLMYLADGFWRLALVGRFKH